MASPPVQEGTPRRLIGSLGKVLSYPARVGFFFSVILAQVFLFCSCTVSVIVLSAEMSRTAIKAAATHGPDKSAYVNRMFGRIAARYDLMNAVMTMGLDRRWRKRTARAAVSGAVGLALDLGTGSGDLALELAARGCRVIGVDFCQPMMKVAQQKIGAGNSVRVALAAADALHLPFPDQTFDHMAAGFALRNFADLGLALREMFRVLKPGGRLAALELTPPQSLGGKLVHRFHTHLLIPTLGRLIAGDAEAYSYLPASVDHFPDARALCQMMLDAGFGRVSYRKFGLGTVAIHLAEKKR